jgi:hypothetical protein
MNYPSLAVEVDSSINYLEIEHAAYYFGWPRLTGEPRKTLPYVWG